MYTYIQISCYTFMCKFLIYFYVSTKIYLNKTNFKIKKQKIAGSEYLLANLT